VSVAITDVSKALPASIFKVQTFKIRKKKKWTFFTLNTRIEPASSFETQVFMPVGTQSHTGTLQPYPGNISIFFNPVKTVKNDSMLEAEPQQVSQTEQSNSVNEFFVYLMTQPVSSYI
jgi:hypothetical protein